MASPALIIKDDGSIEATPELKDMLHLEPGTRLELVSNSGSEIRFHVASTAREIRGWRDLEGFLVDSPVDLNEERKMERQRELEREAHWRD